MRCVIHRFKQVGFTLVELMVSIVVLVIILALAGPSMAEFTVNNHLASSKSAFAATLALARTEAARRGQTVIIQAITGGSVGNEFKAGWELYVDVDGNGAVGGGDTLVRGFDAPSDKVKLSGTSLLAFQATGYLVGGATLNYTLCRVAGGSAGYQVSVMPSGIADVKGISSC